MKCTVVFCVVLLLLTAVSAKKNRHKDEEKSLKKALKECQKNEETHVEGNILKKIRRQKQVELPENYGDHKLCVLKGAGLINEDNSVNSELLKKKVGKKVKDGQDVDAIVSECGASQDNPKATAIEIEKCLLKHEIDL